MMKCRYLGFLIGCVAVLARADGVACSDDYRGGLIYPGSHDEMIVSGSIAYLVYKYGNLIVLDLSDSSSPVQIGELGLPNGARDVCLLDSMLYVANGSGGLLIIDVRNPEFPEIAGVFEGSASAQGVFVENGLAYVTGSEGLQIIEVHDPESPTLIGSLKLDSDPILSSLAVSDGVAYIGSGISSGRVISVDVREPSSPSSVGATDYFHSIEKIIVQDGTMYVATSRSSGVYIYDVREVSAPELMFDSGYGVWRSHDLELVGSVLYLAGSYGVQMLDVRDPSHPQDLGLLETRLSPRRVSVDNGIVRVSVISSTSSSQSGLESFDLDGLFAPSLQSQISLRNGGGQIAESEGVLYLDDGGVMRIFDMSDPLHPKRIAEHAGLAYWSTGVRQVSVVGGVGYVLGEDGVLRLVDLSDPLMPVLIGETSSGEEILEFAVSGESVYLACGGAGLKVLDVSDPAAPNVIGSLASLGAAHTLGADQGLVCVGVEDDGLRLVDASVSDHPVAVGFQPMSHGVVDIAIRDQFVYVIKESVVSGETSLRIYDVSDPSSPFVVYWFTDPEIDMRSISVQGRYAYIENGTSGVVVFDVLDPYFSEKVGLLRRFSGEGQNMIVGDQVMYLVNGDLSVFDASETFECSGCSADFNGDGFADFQDVAAYLDFFSNFESFADLNHDGRWDFFDIAAFLQEYSAGCP